MAGTTASGIDGPGPEPESNQEESESQNGPSIRKRHPLSLPVFLLATLTLVCPPQHDVTFTLLRRFEITKAVCWIGGTLALVALPYITVVWRIRIFRDKYKFKITDGLTLAILLINCAFNICILSVHYGYNFRHLTRCQANLAGIGELAKRYSEAHGRYPHSERRGKALGDGVTMVFVALHAVAHSDPAVVSGSKEFYDACPASNSVFVCDSSADSCLHDCQQSGVRSPSFGTCSLLPSRGGGAEVAGYVPIGKNECVSYSWRRRPLVAADVTSRTILAAEKQAHHGPGLNVLYGDGQVKWVSLSDRQEIARVADACLLFLDSVDREN